MIWRELVKFLLPDYEFFTKDEKEINEIAKRVIVHTNWSEKEPEEKRKEAFDIIKENIIVLGIEVVASYINYAIEKAVRDRK